MINLKTGEQIERMRTAGGALNSVLVELRQMCRPGVATRDIDHTANQLIVKLGAKPSFLGYRGFKYTICASHNDEVVHGFPRKTPLKDGDILSIDCGLVLDGWQADSAFTAPIGVVSRDALKLIVETEVCFWQGLKMMSVGGRLGDVSHAVEAHAHACGYEPVHQMVGHGIGRQLHEDPELPNFGRAGRGVRLSAGMVLALEPMIAMGDWSMYFAEDGWTAITEDRSLASHYEHTVALTAHGPDILTLPDFTMGEDIDLRIKKVRQYYADMGVSD